MSSIENFLKNQVLKLEENHSFRTLKTTENLIDFSSNDYLGFSRSLELKKLIEFELEKYPNYAIGSTGSRLISGNTQYAIDLENELASFHNTESALLFNSGYDANVGIFSCIPQKDDTIILDEKAHASIIDGSRLSYAKRYKFRHNDPNSLEQKLKVSTGNIFIGIESVYSMDGDTPDLSAIVKLAEKYNANIIIDEAHGAGVLGPDGKGLVSALGLEDKIFARIHTFGKAIGAHGAIIMGSNALRNFLINHSRSFIYTTAATFHSIVSIKAAYDHLKNHPHLQKELQEKIAIFKSSLLKKDSIIESNSPIQSIVIPGNTRMMAAYENLKNKGFSVGAVRAPSVAVGMERIRVCLHLFNSEPEIYKLVNEINQYL
ncbi:pyridoxal phosphate-dependent aminotransferase family protein [Solitalea sp. MAHUQ-68]|uniref:Pyridoxal phosphate-dependent aminotransferase family protein n=1 Tax=Solitalea agri TaxID=2953739 RepID=A0A9X2EZ00_9SPHI|nr:pyridoxal phosphate-dependent aminotransferase family protein [Solitalea agri]MCO4291629.1 pyridoxal phosphate-dependent aminotransferase family protein [Solitalea agri]